MKIEIEIPDLHEIAKRELREKDLMKIIQDTKEASCKSIEDQGISVIALIIAETLDTVLEHRVLPVSGFDDKAKSLS